MFCLLQWVDKVQLRICLLFYVVVVNCNRYITLLIINTHLSTTKVFVSWWKCHQHLPRTLSFTDITDRSMIHPSIQRLTNKYKFLFLYFQINKIDTIIKPKSINFTTIHMHISTKKNMSAICGHYLCSNF
jgi:hypothetical protein